jgi:hypothetical protein
MEKALTTPLRFNRPIFKYFLYGSFRLKLFTARTL